MRRGGADVPLSRRQHQQLQPAGLCGDYQGNDSEGIYLVSAKAYFDINDTDGKLPEQGMIFAVDDGEARGKPFFRRYTILTSDCEMGMVVLELEAFDE